MRLLAWPLALVPLLFALGCGSESQGTGSTSGGPEDASDGLFHPPGNGMHTTEADACDSLTLAQQNIFQQRGCAGTTRTCPDFLRSQFMTECLEYDQGSVQGCIDYYKSQPSCAAVTKAISDCAITPFPDSAPKGCPN